MSASSLTPTQVERAVAMWGQGKNLGTIANALRCSIYDLSPWLYRDELRAAMREAEGYPAEERED